MRREFRRWLWDVVDPDASGWPGGVVSQALYVLIAANVVAAGLQTVDALDVRYGWAFDAFAIGSVLLYTVVYLLRVWAATAIESYTGPLVGRLRFVARPSSVLDLLVIGPFILGALLSVSLLSLVRVLWFVRFLGLPRQRHARHRLVRILRREWDDLSIAVTLSGSLALFSATLLYLVERNVQPEAFSSIPAALWWSIATLTTVGYGDVVPVTPLGRILGALTTLGGIALFALPSAILASGFMIDGQRHASAESVQTCPHCGRPLDTGGD